MLSFSNSLESTSCTPWAKKVHKSYTDNFKTESDVFISMCKLKRSGDMAMHNLRFRGFLKDENRFLKFISAMNDSLLMGDIKADPNAKLSWIMPKTKEYYIFSGKFYIASAPIQVTRFPPPKIADNNAADYWERQRLNEWTSLNAKTKAIFTWPSRAEVPKSADEAFSCQTLDNKQKPIIHDIALDNFCLLVFKVSDVEHFDYSSFPPRRTFYVYSAKTDTWNIETANP